MGALPPIPLKRTLRLSASPADLWPLVSNTERFNRALGLPAVTQTGVDQSRYARTVSTRLFGIPLSWREPPFEWVEGRFFSIVREFDSGPIERFTGGMELRPDGAGTTVTVDYTFTPKNGLGKLIVEHATGKQAIEDAERMLKRFDASLAGGGEAFPPRRTRSLPNAEALAYKVEGLHSAPVDRAIASKLLHFIDRAYDDELAGMRPFELADRWGADRLETLRV